MIKEIDGVFSEDECKQMIDFGCSFDEKTVVLSDKKEDIVKLFRKKIQKNAAHLKLDRMHFIRYDIGERMGRHQDLSGPFVTRVLSSVTYLNSVDEGGETKLYLPDEEIKIAPVRGKMVMYPSDIYHESLPTVSNEKYVVTGWFTVK